MLERVCWSKKGECLSDRGIVRMMREGFQGTSAPAVKFAISLYTFRVKSRKQTG
jgi:hypothetical protein